MKWNAFILLLSLCFWPHDAARAATSTNAANPTKATSAASVTNAANPAQLVYNSKTTLDAYNSVGRKDPKWDADARKCLSAYARLCSWTNDVPTELIQEVRTNLARAMTLGCDDPFMRYLHFRFEDPDIGDASAYRAVASDLQQSKYPDIRKFYATMLAEDAYLSAAPRRSELAVILGAATSFLGKALDDPTIPLKEADDACNLLMTRTTDADPKPWRRYQILEPGLTNRWKGTTMSLLAKGRGLISYAWQARGSGFADTVSETGWKLMDERMNLAADTLESAWKADPHDARICVEMMWVELAQNRGRDRMELWFQRGMKIDPGNRELCNAKLEYLRPRWHGSLKEMIAFGRECTVKTNVGCRLHLMLSDAHFEASREIMDDTERAAYWKKPNVWPDIQFTFEKFFELHPEEVGYRHNYARYATWCSQWPEFLKQVKLFPDTNYAYFGGSEKFNGLVKTAEEQVKKQPR